MNFAARLAIIFAIAPLLPVTFALAMGARQPATTALTGASCEIIAAPAGDKTVYQGRITPDSAMKGKYTMEIGQGADGRVASSKSSGTFAAGAGESVTVGRSSIGGIALNGATGGDIEASMTIIVGGAAMHCALSDPKDI